MSAPVTPLNKTFPKQPQDQITSWDVTDLFAVVGKRERYNPDDLVGVKGLPIYGRMMNDEQVKAVSQFKCNAMLARGWQFAFDKGDTSLPEEEQKKRVKVFEAVTKKLRGSFSDGIEGVYSGAEFGYSLTEKVYGTIEVDGSSYVGINKMLTRDPASFRFWTDEFGNIEKVAQSVGGRGRELPIDLARFIYYVHRPMWDTIYGRSDLRATYRWWYAKDQLVKLWLLWTERLAGGFIKATRTEQAPKPGTPEYQTLEDALRRIKTLSAIILPPGVEAEVVFASSSAGDPFKTAIEFCDLAIAKSRLVPNLLGLSHTGQTGAYSQSQTQLEVFFWTLGSDACRVAEALNEQLFRDLGDQNWGDGKYPTFSFKPASMEHVKWVIGTWKDMIQANAVIPTEKDEAHLRELLNMPEREEGDEALAAVKQRLVPDPVGLGPDGKPLTAPGGQGASIPAPAKKPTVGDKDDEEDIEATVRRVFSEFADRFHAPTINVQNTTTPAVGDPRQASGPGMDPGVAVPHGPLRSGAPMEAFQSAASRVHFSVIERRTDDFAQHGVATLSALLARGVRRMLGDDEAMRSLLDENLADVAALEFHKLDVSRLRDESSALLRSSWDLGMRLAVGELHQVEPERSSARRVVAASLRDKAGDFFAARGVRMSEDATDQARRIIQQELQNGVKFGKPIAEVRATIWDRLVAKGLTTRQAARGVETDEAVEQALDLLWQDTVEGAAAYLDTLVRTNTFEALNEARFDAFTDPDMGGFVLALEYASVLDSSTTEICAHLDGRTYAADSPVWDTYRPPNHFNCRSVLIPITAVDGWDGTESPAPTIEPQDGFK